MRKSDFLSAYSYQDGFNIAAIRNYGFIQLIKVHFWFKRIDFVSRFRLIVDFRVRFITKKDERPYLAYHIGAKTYNLWQTTRPFPNSRGRRNFIYAVGRAISDSKPDFQTILYHGNI